MQEVASPSAVAFVENSARLRATHYREEAARFRGMAKAEPLPALGGAPAGVGAGIRQNGRQLRREPPVKGGVRARPLTGMKTAARKRYGR